MVKLPHTVVRLRTIHGTPERADQQRRSRIWYDENTELAKERARDSARANPVARSITEENYRRRRRGGA